MPIKRPCSRPGCPNLVRKGYCEEHRPKRKQTAKKRFYNTARWQRIRKQKLLRDPLCELNAKCKDPTPATHVHHRDGDVRNNRPENLVSCCVACHTHEERTKGALA